MILPLFLTLARAPRWQAIEAMRERMITLMPRLQYPAPDGANGSVIAANHSRSHSQYQPDALAVLRHVLEQRGLGDVMSEGPQ